MDSDFHELGLCEAVLQLTDGAPHARLGSCGSEGSWGEQLPTPSRCGAECLVKAEDHLEDLQEKHQKIPVIMNQHWKEEQIV